MWIEVGDVVGRDASYRLQTTARDQALSTAARSSTGLWSWEGLGVCEQEQADEATRRLHGDHGAVCVE
jgi:hypothetical protein